MSTIGTLFEINGVISTDKSVMQNINTLCTSAGAWMTYDIAEGRWTVIINRAGASTASFNDSNIIGGINISGTGVNELYNSVTIEYPHKDLRDQTDYIDLEIPSADRFPYELDNRLNIKLDCINNPVTAQYLASVELKQSRVDKVIQFRTDYSKIGLKAGDIIDITSSVYGYTAKKFRITKVEEEDTEGLAISITGLEYDENVYSTDGLIRKIREKKTGIIPKDNNDATIGQDVASRTTEVFSFTSGQITIRETASLTDDALFNAFAITSNPSTNDTYFQGYQYLIPYTGTYRLDYFLNWGVDAELTAGGSFVVPDTIRKRNGMYIQKNGIGQVLTGINTTTSILKGGDPNGDISVTGEFTATKGDIIRFFVQARTDNGPNHPVIVAAGYGGGLYPRSIIWTTGTLFFKG
jgi:hypothetical protein